MKCSKCSRESPAGSAFCSNCGASLSFPGGPEFPGAPKHRLPDRTDPAITLGKSPLTLIAIILFCISTLLILIDKSIHSPTSIDLLAVLRREDLIDSEFFYSLCYGANLSADYLFLFLYEIFGEYVDNYETLLLLSLLPRLVLIAGLWTVYGTAASNKPYPSTVGLQIVQVICIVYAAAHTLLWGGSLIRQLSVYDGNRVSDPELFSYLLTALVLVYYLVAHILGAVACSRLHRGFSKLYSPLRVSAFLAFLCVASGFIEIFTAGWMSAQLSGGHIEYCLADILQGAASVLFGIGLFAYNKDLA